MIDAFKDRFDSFHQQQQGLEKTSSRLSWARTILFLSIISLVIYGLSSDSPVALIALIPVGISFYYMVIKHRKVERALTINQTLKDINLEEIKRIQLDLHDFEGGEAYIAEDHPYQQDLDIFGRHSIYQLLSRCEMPDSKHMLGTWLSGPADLQTIKQRQESASELSSKLDWRQSFQANNRINLNKKKKSNPHLSNKDILDWAKKDEPSFNTKLWRIIAYLMGFLVVLSAYLIFAEGVVYHIIYPTVIINGIILGSTIKRLNTVAHGIDHAHYMIETYAQSLNMIEKESFTSEHLKTLQNKLIGEKQSSTSAIRSLSRLSHRLSSRSNMLYGVLDGLFLLDVHLVGNLLDWKKDNHLKIQTWFEVVNEMECLLSVASLLHAHPEYKFPTMVDQPFHFKCEKIGHPLIKTAEKVKNDYSITGKGSVDIITGSNMSGKSTFQRTIGLSMVMAQCGCPVDAASLEMGPVQVFTSMRTKDNLEEHTSSFYAELRRISQLLELASQQNTTFFVLDEILKGTNSDDRHKGSIALVRKLTDKNAFGMVSTHDLELGKIATSGVRNFSFNSKILNNEIIFDYTLTEGLCQSFNASKLMENMGIL
ncbi:MAG: hypothetical protein ABJ004_14715 [Cyclobacteriaceae bacterium]